MRGGFIMYIDVKEGVNKVKDGAIVFKVFGVLAIILLIPFLLCTKNTITFHYNISAPYFKKKPAFLEKELGGVAPRISMRTLEKSRVFSFLKIKILKLVLKEKSRKERLEIFPLE